MITKAVILAGGIGSRLSPVTLEIPKPLIPIHGKTLLEHNLAFLKKNGIEEFYLSVGYMKEMIKSYFGDGSEFGVRITYIEEEEPLGTAGPLLLAKEHLNEPFVCMNVDNLLKADVKEMEKYLERKDATAVIALKNINDASGYGLVKTEGEKIVSFSEKASVGEGMISAGLYTLSSDIMDYIKPGYCMLEKDVFPKLAEEGKLYAYPFEGQWFDTGTFERWQRVIEEWEDN